MIEKEINVSDKDKFNKSRSKEIHSLIQPDIQDFQISRWYSSTESGIENSNINHDSWINPKNSSDNHHSKQARKRPYDNSRNMGFFEFLQQ